VSEGAVLAMAPRAALFMVSERSSKKDQVKEEEMAGAVLARGQNKMN
jgi:hypothetical protein